MFSQSDEFLEGFFVFDGEFGERFPIEGDAGLSEPAHEAAIGEVMLTGSGVDPHDPEATEFAFFLASVAKGVVPRFFEAFASASDEVISSADESSGVAENIFLMFMGGDAPFDAWHDDSLRTVGKHVANSFQIASTDVGGSFEATFLSGGFAFEVVVVERLSPFDASFCRKRKAF